MPIQTVAKEKIPYPVLAETAIEIVYPQSEKEDSFPFDKTDPTKTGYPEKAENTENPFWLPGETFDQQRIQKAVDKQTPKKP